MNHCKHFYCTACAALLALCCATATAQSRYDEKFAAYPTYSGDDLEMTVSGGCTRFRLWSPNAEAAKVNIYDNGHTGKPVQTLDMTADAATGTWTVAVPRELYGMFYTFQIITVR